MGYWKFDEGTGTNAADSSGHGNNGTLTNGPTWSASPTNDISFTNPYALSFDGTDDYVDIPSNASLTLGNNATISLWVKLNSIPSGTHEIIGNDQGYTSGYLLSQYGADLSVYWKSGAPVGAATILSTGTWQHIVVTNGNGTMQIYSNGSPSGGTFTSGGAITFDQALRISSPTWPLDGLLDDVRIYSRALSAAEIAALAAGNHTTAVWDGSSSTNWETAANWDTSAVPDPFTHVIVRQAGSGSPVLAASVSGASLTIEASSSLDLSGFNFELNDGGAVKGGGTLKLKGNEVLSNLGNLATTSTGTVLYYGTGSFTGLTAGNNYNNLTINDGLVGYWKFDEGTGTSAADSSGHGNNGTLTSGPTWSASPTNDIIFTNPYALSFDGADDYVSAGSSATLNPSNAITLSAWVYPNSTSVAGGIISNSLASTNFNGYNLFPIVMGTFIAILAMVAAMVVRLSHTVLQRGNTLCAHMMVLM